MKPAAFDYVRPAAVAEALRVLAAAPFEIANGEVDISLARYRETT